eukprot:7089010-Pyramimonas_sp.AAC.1
MDAPMLHLILLRRGAIRTLRRWQGRSSAEAERTPSALASRVIKGDLRDYATQRQLQPWSVHADALRQASYERLQATCSQSIFVGHLIVFLNTTEPILYGRLEQKRTR